MSETTACPPLILIYPTVSDTYLLPGDTLTLTAINSYDVGPTPYSILIYDEARNLVGETLVGTTCTVSVTSLEAASHTYVAYLAIPGVDGPNDINQGSKSVTVTWVNAPIVLNGPQGVVHEESVTLTVLAAYDVDATPYVIEIVNETTGKLAASSPSGIEFSVTVTLPLRQEQVFCAYISEKVKGSPRVRVQSISNKISLFFSDQHFLLSRLPNF